MTAGDARLKRFILPGGEAHDAAFDGYGGGRQEEAVPLLTDRACEGFKTRLTAWELGFKAVVPPKSNGAGKREYDRELYKRRNETGRFFRRIKAFRAVFTRYGKLDAMFSASVLFAAVIVLLRCVNTP